MSPLNWQARYKMAISCGKRGFTVILLYGNMPGSILFLSPSAKTKAKSILDLSLKARIAYRRLLYVPVKEAIPLWILEKVLSSLNSYSHYRSGDLMICTTRSYDKSQTIVWFTYRTLGVTTLHTSRRHLHRWDFNRNCYTGPPATLLQKHTV